MARRAPFWAWMLGVGAIALSLRLAGLGQPHVIVFDEIYYVPFALDYLHGTPSFDAHPPLGKYFIALGLGLGQWPANRLGWPTVDVNGTLVSPLAFRWLNAVVGATIPLLLAALAWELGAIYPSYRGDRLSITGEDPPKYPLTRKPLKQPITPLFKGGRGDLLTLRQHRFALLAGVLMAMEGLTLVESRLALINIYGLALGLLGQWAWVRARHSPHPDRWRWVAGIALGAAINVKWNWAGMWLGLLLGEIGRTCNPGAMSSPKTANPVGANGDSPSQLTAISTEFNPHSNQTTPSLDGRANDRLPLRSWHGWVAYLGVIPLATYVLLWLPHLAMTEESLADVHRQMWATHQSIGANATHPYCSPWYSWPLMLRPVAYFYGRSGQGLNATVITIHAMGNPVLWWLSTAAVLAVGLGWLARWWGKFRLTIAKVAGQTPFAPTKQPDESVVSFILLNYLANWLPWALVSRCTFLYHAMGMVAFSTLALAWLMAQWLDRPRDRPLALLLLGAIALSFFFWLPLYLGLPLSPDALHRRWLLPGWI